MKRLSLIAAACLLALTSCSESKQLEKTASDSDNLKPGIHSVGRQNDGVVVRVVLLAEKKMQFYAGERQLAEYWTHADSPTDVFIAVRNGGLILGSGMTSSADPLQLGELVFPDAFPDLKAGVDEIVLGTLDGQVPFGVRLIPTPENEMRAIRNHQPIGRANPVSTDATTESEVVELPPPPLFTTLLLVAIA